MQFCCDLEKVHTLKLTKQIAHTIHYISYSCFRAAMMVGNQECNVRKERSNKMV